MSYINLLDEFTKDKIYEMIHIYKYKDVMDEFKLKAVALKKEVNSNGKRDNKSLIHRYFYLPIRLLKLGVVKDIWKYYKCQYEIRKISIFNNYTADEINKYFLNDIQILKYSFILSKLFIIGLTPRLVDSILKANGVNIDEDLNEYWNF